MSEATQNKIGKIIWAASGAVVLGAIGSGVWDLIAKPGLTTVGRWFLDVFTFGSEAVKDFAYESAALDPTPLSALIIISVGSFIPLFVVQPMVYEGLFGEVIRNRIRKNIKNNISGIDDEEGDDCEVYDKKIRVIKKIKRKVVMAAALYASLIFVGLFMGAKVLNQSVLIWRVFNANVEIITPYINDAEVKKLKARFAAVTSRDEYYSIDEDIHEIAKANNIEIRNEVLW